VHFVELAAAALVYLAWAVAGWDQARYERTRRRIRADLEASKLGSPAEVDRLAR
jgi:hypothetical protein